MKLLKRQIYIYHIYSPITVKKISGSILILDWEFNIGINKEFIILGNFNIHHKLLEKFVVLIAHIKKSEKIASFYAKKRNRANNSYKSSNI